MGFYRAGCPDTGYNSLPIVSGSTIMGLIGENFSDTKVLDSNEIWKDEDENIKPVVKFPGAYCSICVDIDVHDLIIVAITDTRGAVPGIATFIGNVSLVPPPTMPTKKKEDNSDLQTPAKQSNDPLASLMAPPGRTPSCGVGSSGDPLKD